MKEKYGFVYIWRDKKYSRYYIGSHWGFENDGYICSSNWMTRSYKRRPHDFKRRILSRIYTNKKELLDEENVWLSLIKLEEIKIKYYNLRIHDFNHWSTDADLTLTVKEKLSKASKGNTHKNAGKWKKGKRASITTEFGNKPTWNKGKTIEELYSDTQKAANYRNKLSEAHKGKKLSESTKDNLRNLWSGTNNPNAKAINTPYGKFNTMTECEKNTKYSKKQIYIRVKSEKYHDWSYV